MKLAVRVTVASILLTLLFAITVFAGTWEQDAGGWRWRESGGQYARNCWMWIDGNNDGVSECYYFGEDGYCFIDTMTPDNYRVNANGAWVEGNVVQTRRHAKGPGGEASVVTQETSQLAKDKVAQLGGTLKAAYDWCANGGIRYVRDHQMYENLGMRWYANRGFTTGTGNCFDMAACFTEMARALGYQADCISGYVPRRSGGLTPHGWCEIIIDGEMYVCDPNFQYETKGNGYMIHYGQHETWRYQQYHVMQYNPVE